MKKNKYIILFALILILSISASMLVSCTGNNNKLTTTTTNLTTSLTTTTANLNTTGTSITPVIKTDTGSYVGKTNNNGIQVKMADGTTKDYTLSVNFVAAFQAMTLNKDDKVKVSYYDQAGGLPMVTNIEKI